MNDSAKAAARSKLCMGPQPGEIYRHYKGGHYTVMGRAFHEQTLEQLVIYTSNKFPGNLVVRSLENFTQIIKCDDRLEPEPRFRRIKENP